MTDKEIIDKKDEILALISRLEIFADLAGDKNKIFLEKLFSFFSVKNFREGEIILDKNEAGRSLYILVNGEVQMLRTTLEGSPFALSNLKAEENVCFGKAALLGEDFHGSSVKALSDCTVLELRSQDFLSLCEEMPAQGSKVIYRIACRLAKALQEATKDSLTLYQALLDEVGMP
ncbi:cyclic nucleotide-binding domain-containing protein [Treponema sp. OMZ 799]|uniref:cyclic nucleotide-binding domain-containing protein n=1 Tax=Treponema sp. OMZ 799 TaxID=2563668 RepID=UPI0020A2DB48|nr:cyclic nucleotide-binding domain-containing protein [Treponema sp. OMZ 799]UTC77283.1 cyclic nucleotide-binding domain-containing protein [Treponema sp. OMZ 799]